MKKFVSIISACFTMSLAAAPNTEIKAVVFDRGGVVTYVDYSTLEEYVMDTLELSKDELNQTVSKMLAFVKNGGTEKSFWESYFSSKDALSFDNWYDQYIETFKKAIVKIQGTEDIIKKLKETGYQTAMLSNIPEPQSEILKELGYYDPFNPVVLSWETGLSKPDPEAFKLLLARLQLPASAVIFIDDKSQNVEAAKKEGIDSIQFVSPEQLSKELVVRGILYAETSPEVPSKDWMIGGKIHFEEQSGINYIGTVEINELTRKTIKNYFDIQIDSCAHNAKALLKKENDRIILTHYEERSKPGIGEEMHATLLYTKKRVENGHETLRDIYENLRNVDPSLPCDRAPTVEQVSDAYQKIIKSDWKFQIVDVVFVSGTTGSGIVAKLQLNGQDEIPNSQGKPISGDFLHLSLAMTDASMGTEMEKIQLVASALKEKLSGKMIKIGDKNGQADLEFGISGSVDRLRPK